MSSIEQQLQELLQEQGGSPVVIPGFIILRTYYDEDSNGNIMYHTEAIQDDLEQVLDILERKNEESDFDFLDF